MKNRFCSGENREREEKEEKLWLIFHLTLAFQTGDSDMMRVEAQLVSFSLLLCFICGLVVVFRGERTQRSVLIQDNKVPTFDWSDKNVDLFYKACQEGNEGACKDLVSSDAALASLNRRAFKGQFFLQPQPSQGNPFLSGSFV